MKFRNVFLSLIVLIFVLSNIGFADVQSSNLDTNTSTSLSSYSANYNKYINKPYGYEIVLPNYLKLNEDIVSVKSRFESENLVVELLYDNFENTLDTFSIYNDYGNRGIKKNPEFNVTNEYYHNFNGVKGYIVLYNRNKISSPSSGADRNYYATISFARSDKEVITVFMKSADPIYIEYIMKNFKFINKTGEMKQDAVFEPTKKNFDPLTQEFYDKYFINNDKVDFGIFEPTFPIYKYKLQQLEKMFDYKFPVALTYNSFELPFKTDYMYKAKEEGKVIEYTLYTTDKINGKDTDITLQILKGNYDEYLNKLAEDFNKYDYPVLFRLNNEMNGAWDVYSSYFLGKDSDLYIECWKYIYDKFQENGVDNLVFVWNPNELSFPNYAYNHYLTYFPGNEYVDVVGLTAYNTGTYYKGETWRTFNEAYDHVYYDYIERFKHPMMITEYSCSSTGGNKPAWFKDMFSQIEKYDRIKLAVLWNGQDYDTTKPGHPVSRNYRLNLDEPVIQEIKAGLQNYK
jgi:hypothetical protein